MRNIDETPKKKREVVPVPEREKAREGEGLLAQMISILPNWKSIIPSVKSQEVLPLSLPQSMQSHSTSEATSMNTQEVDSKKRQREVNSESVSRQSDGWEDIPIDSDDDIVGVKKVPRKSERNEVLPSAPKTQVRSYWNWSLSI